MTWRFTERLDEDGSFEAKDRIVELFYAFSLSVDGTVRWGSASVATGDIRLIEL